jgi:hypothetical protein
MKDCTYLQLITENNDNVLLVIIIMFRLFTIFCIHVVFVTGTSYNHGAFKNRSTSSYILKGAM